MAKTCPFTENKLCGESCPLYISPDDLNEFVVSRLSSIGIIDKKIGACSLKALALSQARIVFEKTSSRG